jgi:hypothetical protein
MRYCLAALHILAVLCSVHVPVDLTDYAQCQAAHKVVCLSYI